MRGWNKRKWGGRGQKSEVRDQRAPVKFATLVFFEEFNGVNRGRVRTKEGEKSLVG
jgi:hypothetical protein